MRVISTRTLHDSAHKPPCRIPGNPSWPQLPSPARPCGHKILAHAFENADTIRVPPIYGCVLAASPRFSLLPAHVVWLVLRTQETLNPKPRVQKASNRPRPPHPHPLWCGAAWICVGYDCWGGLNLYSPIVPIKYIAIFYLLQGSYRLQTLNPIFYLREGVYGP